MPFRLEWLENRIVPTVSVINTYVNAGWSAVGVGTDPDGAGPATAMGTDAFATIQAGVNAVSPGGTVNVASGTYSEAVTIAKSLTLTGDTSVSRPVIELPSGASVVTITASNVTVQGVQINKNDQSSDTGLVTIPRGGSFPNYTVAYSNITLNDIAFTKGRRAAYITGQNVTIENSTFAGQLRDALYFDAVAGTTTITNNQFTGTSNKAILIEGFTGIPSSSGTVNISQNTCSGKANFFVYNSWGDAITQKIGLNVTNNTVSSTSNAVVIYDVRVDGGSFDPANFVKITGMTVTGNNFSGVASGKYAVIGVSDVTYPIPVNAGGNWWGTTDLTTVAAKISGNVDFSPILPVGTDTDLVTLGFQGDYSNLTVHTLGQQIGAVGRIQEGINLATGGGTVSVIAGSYVEDVNLNKDVTVAIDGVTTVSGKISGTTGIYQALGAVSLGDGSVTGVSFSSTLNVNGQTVTLLDSNGADLDGETLLDGGTLIAAGGIHVAGTLEGPGTISGAVTVESSGEVVPGTPVGVVTATSTTFQSGSTLSIDLNGPVEGVDYDQLIATSAASISGAMLDVTLGFTPSVGESFVILKNQGGSAVGGGAFSGVNGVIGALGEGSVISLGGKKFALTFVGGNSGHDVALTVLPPNTNLQYNDAGITPGQRVSATVSWRNLTSRATYPQTVKIYRSWDGTLDHLDALLASTIINPVQPNLGVVVPLSWTASVADSNAPDSLGVVTPDGTASSYLVVIVDEENVSGDNTFDDDWSASSSAVYTVTVPDITFDTANADLTAAEGLTNSGNFILRRGGDTSLPLTVYVDWNSPGQPNPAGPADFGGKFPGSAQVGAPTAVTFLANNSTATLSVSPVIDSNSSPSEKLTETLHATLIPDPTGPANQAYTIDKNATGEGEALMEVEDVVNTITLRALDATATETRSTTAKFRLRRGTGQSAALPVVVTVDFGGTSTPGPADDFQALIGKTSLAFYANGGGATLTDITIPARRSYVDFTIKPVEDDAIEGPETIIPAVQADPTNNQRYIPGTPASASATLADNDDVRLAAGIAGIPSTIKSPSNASQTRIRFTVSVSNLGASGVSPATILQVGLLNINAGPATAATYNSSALLLKSALIGTIAINSTKAKTFSIKTSSIGLLAPGTYRIVAKADAANAVTETNELDNYAFTSGIIVVV